MCRRKDREIQYRKRGLGEWVSLGGNVGVGYLPPLFDQHGVRSMILKIIRAMDTIMGHFNCCGGTKKRALEELIEAEHWFDIETIQHTHKWGGHMCRINRVLARGGGRRWAIEEGWGCLRDHKAIGAKVQLKEDRKLQLT